MAGKDDDLFQTKVNEFNFHDDSPLFCTSSGIVRLQDFIGRPDFWNRSVAGHLLFQTGTPLAKRSGQIRGKKDRTQPI